MEPGGFEGPGRLTSTQSVGMVFEETIKWRVNKAPPDVTDYNWSDPVVAETWGGELNDENAFYVRPEHVVEAIETAQSGRGKRKATSRARGWRWCRRMQAGETRCWSPVFR